MKLSDLAILLAMIALVIACSVSLAWVLGYDPWLAGLFGCLWGATVMAFVWRMACKRLPDEPPGEKVTWRTGR